MSFTDPRATLPWGLHDPTAFPDDDDNRGCLKRLTKSVEILMRGLGGVFALKVRLLLLGMPSPLH